MSAPLRNDYSRVAAEYYSASHETCRAFEAATERFTQDNNHWIAPAPVGIALDIGSGAGLSTRYLGQHAAKIVELDLHREMIDQSDCDLRLQGSAVQLPFGDEVFDRVTGFLFDPFNISPLENEVARVLPKGGSFVGTVPSWDWASTLRYINDIDLNQTRFHLDATGEEVFLPSYTSPPRNIEQRFKEAGFESIEIDPVFPDPSHPIPKHISLAAKLLKIHPEKLEIVSFIKATK